MTRVFRSVLRLAAVERARGRWQHHGEAGSVGARALLGPVRLVSGGVLQLCRFAPTDGATKARWTRPVHRSFGVLQHCRFAPTDGESQRFALGAAGASGGVRWAACGSFLRRWGIGFCAPQETSFCIEGWCTDEAARCRVGTDRSAAARVFLAGTSTISSTTRCRCVPDK